MPVFNNGLFTNKKIQTKTYVHKKFSNNNNINNINNKLSDKNNKNNIIKFQKKIIITNKKNNMHPINITEDNKENQKNNDNKDINNYNNNEIKSNNINILNQKIIIPKQENDDILNNENGKKEKEEKMIYSSPIRPELLKNAIISDTKKKVVNDYDNDNEQSNINTTDKKDLLKIIYSPSNNIKQSTNKKK